MLHPAATLLAILLLAGCVPSEPVISPPPEPHSTPIFASDEDALAAATEAYAKYLAVSDQILSDGGKGEERLLTVATREWAELQNEGFAEAREKGWHSTGTTTFDSLRIEQYDSHAVQGAPIMRAYVCIDVSSVDVLDARGVSVVSTDRPDRSPAEIAYSWFEKPNRGILIAHIDPWGGRDFCTDS
ncbi:hypothetical protein BKA04_002104 [Cryobacterium mesophilum]|uniref:Uncharacterized protein n=1 Tax=Terrimesophilobacter mesophilus TaxID=433647 RepID=A0A4R8VFF5_9MICO|nr:hypothetical protein [Terrimesophilobacter mesophilus]MBB5633881.1 hypothetical protein [Terrimesophilobacter mesophilus]TFB80557.1 hypothetical protein E3N84_11230 [Terrimesophilobacter mesophilus]